MHPEKQLRPLLYRFALRDRPKRFGWRGVSKAHMERTDEWLKAFDLLCDEIPELVEGFEGFVGEGSFETPPDLLARVEFWAIGWQEQREDIAGPNEPPGLVESPIVHGP